MKESIFTGGLLGLIGITLLAMLIIVCTLGIGTPWAIVVKEQWVASHTYIEGRQLAFKGTGGSLLLSFIGWIILIIFTFGIFIFWVNISLKKWIVANTYFAN